MKTIKLLLLVIIATVFSNCATSNEKRLYSSTNNYKQQNIKGLYSSTNNYKQQNIKSTTVNNNGLYVSNQ